MEVFFPFDFSFQPRKNLPKAAVSAQKAVEN
jgi:hypothetical protein